LHLERIGYIGANGEPLGWWNLGCSRRKKIQLVLLLVLAHAEEESAGGVPVRGWECLTDGRDLVLASYHVAVVEGGWDEVYTRGGRVVIRVASGCAVRG
jgi:hypothetical protein